MKKAIFAALPVLALTLASFAAPSQACATDAEKLFKKRCAMCHALDRKKTGPAVKDMNKDPKVLKETIANGRKMMPKFGEKLSEEEIDALVAFIQKHQQ